MTSKLLNASITALLACTVCSANAFSNTGAAWEGSPVGHCFRSIEQYLSTSFGPEYRSDENIKVVPVKSITSHQSRETAPTFVWVTDVTPGINATRILFRVQPIGKACAILYAPLSSTVSLKTTFKGSLPTRVTTLDSPPPGFEANQIIYRLNPKSGTYSPATCFKVASTGKQRKINCNLAFTD